MARHYVTFGQGHQHRIADNLLDKDTVAVFQAKTQEEGRKKAFELFGPKFCFEYHDTEWDESTLSYFPKGYVHLDGGADSTLDNAVMSLLQFNQSKQEFNITNARPVSSDWIALDTGYQLDSLEIDKFVRQTELLLQERRLSSDEVQLLLEDFKARN